MKYGLLGRLLTVDFQMNYVHGTFRMLEFLHVTKYYIHVAEP